MTAAGTVLTPTGEDYNNVQQAYHEFWHHIVNISGEKAKPITKEALVVNQDKETGWIRAETPLSKSALEFRGVSSRTGAPSRSVYDIYIQVEQVIRAVSDGNGGRIYEATTSVVRTQYLEYRSDREIERERVDDNFLAKSFSGVHYDLDFGTSHHPLFHAQFDYDCIPASALRRRYKKPDDTHKCTVPRIPTPPIDLAGVVYIILHDHLGSVVKKGWPKEVAEAASRLPQFPHQTITTQVIGEKDLRCPQWYLHGGHTP